MGRKKDFTHIQEVRGRRVNVVEGLELHTNVLSPDEQRVVVRQIEDWVEQGRQVASAFSSLPGCLIRLSPCCARQGALSSQNSPRGIWQCCAGDRD